MKISNYLVSSILLNLIFIQNITSQDLKNYIGSFSYINNTGYSISGVADYQYYEDDDLERIYNGGFKFTSENNSLITGQYLNNKRVGDWKILINIDGTTSSMVKKDILECSGSYIDGKKNGNWTYKTDYDFDTKTYKVIDNLTFKNDTIIGKLDNNIGSDNCVINCSSTAPYCCLISGGFDENGLMTGVWKVKKEKEHQNIIIEFYKGYLIKYIIQNEENGAFSKKYLPNKELIVKKIDDLYSNKTNIPSFQINPDGNSDYREVIYDTHKEEFGTYIFSSLDNVIDGYLYKITRAFNRDLTPFEWKNKNGKVYVKDYYKEPKILYQWNDVKNYYEAYMPTGKVINTSNKDNICGLYMSKGQRLKNSFGEISGVIIVYGIRISKNENNRLILKMGSYFPDNIEDNVSENYIIWDDALGVFEGDVYLKNANNKYDGNFRELTKDTSNVYYNQKFSVQLKDNETIYFENNYKLEGKIFTNEHFEARKIK